MLRNHGLLTVGETVADAFLSMYYLEASCQIQVRAQSGGGELISVPRKSWTRATPTRSPTSAGTAARAGSCGRASCAGWTARTRLSGIDWPELTQPESSLRFGAAAGARRSEDGPLLTGRGRFTDDLTVPGQAHAVFVRATVGPRRRSGAVDVTSALALPGVLAILTGADARADGLGAIPPAAAFPGRGGVPLASAPIPPLAIDRVRYVGEAVAIADRGDTRAGGRTPRRRWSSISTRSRPRPTWSARSRPGRPRSGPSAPGQRGLRLGRRRRGCGGGGLRRRRACRTRAPARHAPGSRRHGAARGHRQWDPADGRYTLIASTQGVAVVRRLLAEGVFKIPRPAATRDHPRCRRRLRHEGPGLPGVRGPALRGAPRRPPGEVARHARGELPGRHRRPRRHA